VNSLQPLKRPLHTLSAVIVSDPEGELAFGLSGGHFRPQLHYEILTNIYHYGMDVQRALEFPRFIWHPSSALVEVEEGLKIPEGFGGFTFRYVKYPSRLGVAAAVRRVGGVLSAHCDIRGEGIPLGLL